MSKKIRENEEEDTLYEGGDRGCEDENICCLCIPLKTGVTIIAVWNIVWAILTLYSLLTAVSLGSLKWVTMIGYVPSLLADYIFLRWLMDDNKETRENLPRAALLQMLAIIAISCWNIILFVFIANYDAYSNSQATSFRF